MYTENIVIHFSGVSEPVAFKKVVQLDGLITLSWLDFTIDLPCVNVASRRYLTNRASAWNVTTEISLLRNGEKIPGSVIINNKGDIVIDKAQYCDVVLAGTVMF